MKKYYSRVAICVILSMIVGLFSYTGRSAAGSDLKVQLVITDTYVTHKTYPLAKGRHRQLQVKLDNAFGTTSIKFKSKDKNKATVTKKGYIEARKKGTVKICVKVTCQSGSRKKTKDTWVKIKVTKEDEPIPTDSPVYTEMPGASYTPYPTSAPPINGEMQATLIVNGVVPAQFPMTILDTTCGRALYNSLPKVLYFNDRDKNTKIANEDDYETGYTRDDEYKPGSLVTGDFMLYGVDRYELTYKDHTTGFAYTRLGRLTSTTGLDTSLGSGAVSVTIIKSALPTAGPSTAPGATPASGATPPVSRTPSPAPGSTVAPGVTVSPGVTVKPGTTVTPIPSLKPGTSATPLPSGSPGVGTPTPRPTPYVGNAIVVTVNGYALPFVPVNGSSVATEFYNDLGSGVQTYEMAKHEGESRYWARLSKQYNETTASTPAQWPAGSLVLMGNNEITVFLRTISNDSGRASTIIARMDEYSKPEGISMSAFLGTYFVGSTVTAQFSKN